MHGTYTQHIRDTRKMWAAMPKPQLLDEVISLNEAQALIEADSSDDLTRAADLRDLVDGHRVCLRDGTNLKQSLQSVRHWR